MPKNKKPKLLATISALVGIGAGAGLIGSADSVMNKWFDQTNPTAEQSIQQGHCEVIYDNWTQLELTGKSDAADELLSEVQECNAANSGLDSANAAVEVEP